MLRVLSTRLCPIGVKAFVDVRSKHANHSLAVSEELRKLGAIIYDKLLPNVTHIIFKDGSKATEAKAHKYGAHLVSVNWVDGFVFRTNNLFPVIKDHLKLDNDWNIISEDQ